MERVKLNIDSVVDQFKGLTEESLELYTDIRKLFDAFITNTSFMDIASLTSSLNDSPYTGATTIGKMFKAGYDWLSSAYDPVDGMFKASITKDKKSYSVGYGLVDNVIKIYDSTTFKKSSK